MPPRTRVRRRSDGDDGMSNDPQGRALRARIKAGDTADTWALMTVTITGPSDLPGEVITETNGFIVPRAGDELKPDLADMLPGKMVFIYESDNQVDRPGWALATDREICLHEALGDSLIPLGEPRTVHDLLRSAGAEECRWVSTQEREQRQPDFW